MIAMPKMEELKHILTLHHILNILLSISFIFTKMVPFVGRLLYDDKHLSLDTVSLNSQYTYNKFTLLFLERT